MTKLNKRHFPSRDLAIFIASFKDNLLVIVVELEACGIDPNIEDFLQHEIIVYNKKKERQRRSPTPLENLLYSIIMTNQETQTQDTEEINCHVKKELDSLSLQLLEYNEKTFGSFMQEITKQLEERINANNKLHSEINQQKLKLQKVEKLLASLKPNNSKASVKTHK
ncbi:hypothetical protein Glove_162g17 [Diversispora epigaea]|uniref:Uncharacterized protein n=1 Tax=Diversispora epigaea TaxID=1348612 RepID=A0A397IU14_9GLOM|nr:hypothetical protein Glove_162g17 [Diversispora epigaea]